MDEDHKGEDPNEETRNVLVTFDEAQIEESKRLIREEVGSSDEEEPDVDEEEKSGQPEDIDEKTKPLDAKDGSSS